MQILEHGQNQERTLLFFPCTAELVMVHPEKFCRYAEKFLTP